MTKNAIRKFVLVGYLLMIMLTLSGCFAKKIMADDTLQAPMAKEITSKLYTGSIAEIVGEPVETGELWLVPSPTPVPNDLFDKVFGRAREMIPTIMPKPAVRTEKWGTVTVQALNVRNSPGTGGAVIGGLTLNQRVQIESEQEGWYQVILDDGQNGWTAADFMTVEEITISGKPTAVATPAPQSLDEKGVILADSLNVRSMPSTSGSIVGATVRYQCVDLLDEQDGWYQIRLNNSTTGWSASDYIQPAEECPPPGASNSDAGTASASSAVQPVSYSQSSQSESAQSEPYSAQPIKVNARVTEETHIHECFGGGWDEIRFVPSNTPVEVVGTGPWVPPEGQEGKVGPGPYLKIRIWDGQYGWIGASAVNVNVENVAQISGICEEGDRIDWSSVEKPTPRPTPPPRVVAPAYPTRPPAYNPNPYTPPTYNNPGTTYVRPTATPQPVEHKYRDE